MAANDARELLHGLLVQRLGLVRSDVALDAIEDWKSDASRSVLEVFLARGLITGEARLAIETVAAELIRTYGSAWTALDELAAATVRDSLAIAPPPDPLGETTPMLSDTRARGRYEAQVRIGEGGMGQVWRGVDGDLGRVIAIKRIVDGKASDNQYCSLFMKEARIHARLLHPGIVTLYDIGKESNGAPFSVMRYVDGSTLLQRVTSHYNNFTPEQHGSGDERLAFLDLVQRLSVVCETIEYAHRQNVLHRDLTPNNIIFGDLGESLVIDWGIAEDVVTIPPAGQQRHGRPFGTLVWSSPESADGRIDDIDHRSDVYGLGANLYLILTGKAPITFDRTSEKDRLRACQDVIHGVFPRPALARPDVPRALEAICLKAMARRREDRYQTAEALAADIKRFLADEAVSVYRDPLPTRAFRWARRHRTAVTAAAVLVATSLVGLTAGTVLVNEQRKIAVANADLAREAIKTVYHEIGDDAWSVIPNSEENRRRMAHEANKLFDGQLRLNPGDTKLMNDAALSYRREANLARMVGRYDEAAALYEEAEAMHRRIERRDRRELEPGERLMLLADRSVLADMRGDPDTADRYKQTLGLAESVAGQFPRRTGDVEVVAALVKANYGRWLTKAGWIDEGRRYLIEARDRLAAAVGTDTPRVPDTAFDEYRMVLARSLLALSDVSDEAGKRAEAVTAAKDALDLVAREISLSKDNPHPDVLQLHAETSLKLASLSPDSVTTTAAPGQSVDEAIAVIDRLARRNQLVATRLETSASAHLLRGRLASRTGNRDVAKADYKAGYEAIQKRMGDIPGAGIGPAAHEIAAGLKALRARIFLDEKDLPNALGFANEAREHLRRALAVYPGSRELLTIQTDLETIDRRSDDGKPAR